MIRVLTACLAFCLILGAETDYRFAFPQSELLMGVDVKWLLKSPLGVKMRSEVGGSVGEFKLLEEVVDQVDAVYVSVVSKAPVKGAKPGANSKNNSDLVMLVKGNFSLDKLTALAVKNGMRQDQWGKVKVLVPVAPKGKPRAVRMQNAQFSNLPMGVDKAVPVFALLDEKNIVVAEDAPLRVALERIEGGLTPQANPLFERARDLEAANDVWIVGSTAPLNLNAGGKQGASDPFSQTMSQVRNFAIGVAVRRNFAVDLQLQTVSPKAATQMLDMARGILALAKASAKPEDPLPIDLDKALELSSSGNVVKASLTLDQAELDKIVAQGLIRSGLGEGKPELAANEAPAAAPVAPVVSAAPPAVVKPVAPQRKTVMIYGMPGGPKEVPVQ
jgi:hypothetical protein